VSTTVPSIEVAEDQNRVVFLVKSRGTFQLAPLLKGYVNEKLKTGSCHFEINMSDCAAMDSSFLGTLAGLSYAIKKAGGTGSITIRQANERNTESLKNLGIDRLFQMAGEMIDYPGMSFQPLTNTTITKNETMKQSLEAHETLIKADDANQAKFKDVVDMLKKDLSKE